MEIDDVSSSGSEVTLVEEEGVLAQGQVSSTAGPIIVQHPFRAVVKQHLNDYALIINAILEHIYDCRAPPEDFDLFSGWDKEVEPKEGVEMDIPLERLMRDLLRKDALLQESVKQMREREKVLIAIEDTKRRLRQADDTIAAFAKKIGNLEHTLLQSVQKPPSESLQRDLDGSETVKKPFSVHQLIVLSERLSITSCPPQFVEGAGMSVQKPPAPMEEYMGQSSLHKTLDQLLEEAARHEESTNLQRVSAKTALAPLEDAESLMEKYIDQDSEEDEDGDLSAEMLQQLWRELK